MSVLAADKKSLVVGLGKTGLSCVEFLVGRGHTVIVADTRQNPPGLVECQTRFPHVAIHCGSFDVELFKSVDQLVVSPGVSLKEPSIESAAKAGVLITGDIDLFARYAQAPIVAITGSNGKSTVTTLVGEMASRAGVKVAVGGNLGTPALDLLADDVDLYVLELSSFQLETTERLGADVVTLLNLSEDHMDRYARYQDYYNAKQRIFRDCKHAVINEDDLLSQPLIREGMATSFFGLSRPEFGRFSTQVTQGELEIVDGFEVVLKASELKIKGMHNISNALAALTIGRAAGLALPPMIAALKDFAGLPHRCQFVADFDGVQYINDSKGTNVGASVTAIRGFGSLVTGKVILLAGGDGKGQDFSPLAEPIKKYARVTILFGRDADLISAAVGGEVIKVSDLSSAVNVASKLALAGDVVLLSPGCASFDMFSNYEHRGQVFIDAVNQLGRETIQ